MVGASTVVLEDSGPPPDPMSPTSTIFRPEPRLAHADAPRITVADVQLEVAGDDGPLRPSGGTDETVHRGPRPMSGCLRRGAGGAADRPAGLDA